MEIDIKGGLRVKIDEKNKTASIIESPKATGNVLIPRFAEYKNIKYKIISIETNSFFSTEIESVTFPEDSEVETFKSQIFGYSKIKKLRIPPKLKNIDYDWHRNVKNNIEIEISPKNDHFIYYDNKFFLGKSEENSDEFDALYYMRKDIENVVIPSHIKIIKSGSFLENKKLKSITFTKNSKLKIIERNAFESSGICKLVLPSSIKRIDDDCFSLVYDLTEISILPGNEIFRVNDNKYLLKKSQRKSQNYDFLLFAVRDIENVIIPSYIKVINNNAFFNCKQLKSVTFESNSSLELLGSYSFWYASGPEKIVFPPSLKEIGSFSFLDNKNIKYTEFLSKSLKIGYQFVSACICLLSVSFPNADNIILDGDVIYGISKETKFYVRRDAIISGKAAKEFQNMAIFIEEDNKPNKKEEKSKKSSNEIESEFDEANLEKRIQEIQKEKKDLERYIFYLKSRLKKFEEIPTIEEFLKNENKYQTLNESDEEDIQTEKVTPFDGKKSEMKLLQDEIQKLREKIKRMECKNEPTNIPPKVPELQIFESKEVDQFKLIRTIGRGAQSEVYEVSQVRHLALKVLLTETSQIRSKQKYKTKSKKGNVNDLQRLLQEYEILNILCHRNILRTYGFCFGDDTHAPSILLQFCPNDLEEVVKDMTDIERICCIFEISSGMEAVHAANLIHRDLKPSNILIDEKGHVRVADFGLSCLVDVKNQLQSLTAGIGTFKFMAPELLNESTHYTNKVDVYSFGVVVFFILTGGEMPNIKMSDQSNGKKANIPKNINKVSRKLINQCWEEDPESRPSFTEIVEYIKNNDFKLINDAENDIEEIKEFLSL